MIKKIYEEIKKHKNILITAHINPDGDALGSALAFKYMIEKKFKDKKVEIIIEDILPKYMEDFLEKKDILNSIDTKDYLLIFLGTANLKRAAISSEIYENAIKTINIDHHISNTKYADINYIVDICSTSQLLYEFLVYFKIELDEKIAKFMYLGIINDTGNFKHTNVDENTFLIASKLIRAGANNNEIFNTLYSKTENKARVYGLVYNDAIKVEDINFYYYYIDYKTMMEKNLTKDDTDGISELLLGIRNCDISLFIRQEKNGNIKGSFRTDKYDVNKIASLFSGGGHIKAAGFSTDKTFTEIIKTSIEEIKKQRSSL